MRDGYLGRTNVRKHWVEVSPVSSKPTFLAQCDARAEVQKAEKIESDEMLLEGAPSPA